MKTLYAYYARVPTIRLCPTAKTGNDKYVSVPIMFQPSAGTAATPWFWGPCRDPNLRLGSYAINGWLFYYETTHLDNHIDSWVKPQYASHFFQRDSNIPHPDQTPYFMDAIWPTVFPKSSSLVASDLFFGDPPSPGGKQVPGEGTGLGNCSIARHPLKRDAKAISGKPVPGSINMSFADGHTALIKLQDIKNVYWYLGYQPVANPWSTAP